MGAAGILVVQSLLVVAQGIQELALLEFELAHLADHGLFVALFAQFLKDGDGLFIGFGRLFLVALPGEHHAQVAQDLALVGAISGGLADGQRLLEGMLGTVPVFDLGIDGAQAAKCFGLAVQVALSGEQLPGLGQRLQRLFVLAGAVGVDAVVKQSSCLVYLCHRTSCSLALGVERNKLGLVQQIVLNLFDEKPVKDVGST